MRGFIGILVFSFVFLTFSSVFAQDTHSRFSLYGGLFMPSGSYEEPGFPEFEYENGFGIGFEYDYFFNRYFGLGAYLEVNSFDSEEKVISGISYKLSGTSTIFGISGVARAIIGDHLWFLGSLKLGVASNSLEAEGSRSGVTHTEDTDGSSPAVSIEGGVGYMFNNWEIGLILKYTAISQDVEGGDDTEMGGTSVLLSMGYNF
jgi:hypothetical protein